MVIGLLGGLAGGLAKGLLGGGTKAAASKSGKSVASKMLGAAKPEETAITKTKPKTKLVPVGGKGSAAAESAVKGLQSEEKEEKEGLPGLKSVLDSIRKSLASIKKTMGNMIRFDKQDAKEKNTRRLKALRNIAAAPVKFAGSLMGAALGAVSKTGFLDMIKNYFTQIVIGGLVLWIVKNAQEIIKKLREAFDKIKEVVDLINEYLIQPIWNIVKAVAGPIYDTIQDILAYPPIQDAVDKIANELEFIMKQIPIIGDAMNALEDRANQPRTDFSGGGGGGGGYRAAAAPSPVAGDKEFQTGVTALAKKYDLDEDDLYAVMSFETAGTFDPAQKNMAGSGATGLIQFTQKTAEGLGTTTAELARMSRTEQLKYVDKYFANKGIQGGNLDDLYMAILFPAAVGKPDDYVLFGRGARAGYGPGSRAYSQNSGLDVNGDGSVTKAEAAAEARKHKGRAPRPPSEVAPSAPPSQQPSTGRSRARAGESRVSQDIKEFRQFRTKFGGTAERRPTSQPDYYQIREMGVYGSGNYDINPLADDTSYEIEVHKGAGHHENRAFDIPVPVNSSQGDAVNEFWKSRGYKTIWRSAGHYDHVHVEVPKNKADEFFRIMSPSPAPPSEQAQHVSRSTSYDSDKYGRTQLVAVAVPTPSGGGSSGGGIRPTISGGSRAGDTRQASRAAAQSQLFKNA